MKKFRTNMTNWWKKYD